MPTGFHNCEEKVSYPDRDAANLAGAIRPVQLWTYRCPCGMWHLTSTAKGPRWLKVRAFPVAKPGVQVQRSQFADKLAAAIRKGK